MTCIRQMANYMKAQQKQQQLKTYKISNNNSKFAKMKNFEQQQQQEYDCQQQMLFKPPNTVVAAAAEAAATTATTTIHTNAAMHNTNTAEVMQQYNNNNNNNNKFNPSSTDITSNNTNNNNNNNINNTNTTVSSISHSIVDGIDSMKRTATNATPPPATSAIPPSPPLPLTRTTTTTTTTTTPTHHEIACYADGDAAVLPLPRQQEQQQQQKPQQQMQQHCGLVSTVTQRICVGRWTQQQQQLERFLHALMFTSILLLISKQFQSVSATNSLLSKHEPMFISRSETFKFVAGDTIVLPCEVANTDPYVVAWKRGKAILSAGSVKVTPDPRVRMVNGYNLQIRDAVPQDAGDYICQIATMEPREITHTVEILVPPRIHHISTGGHLQVKKGSSVRIECSATGNPMPNVTWSRKNNILPNGEEKLHSHILSIENVDRHKGGVYICTANNGVGQTASSQVVLHVLYPPEISVERPVVFSGEGHEAMLVCIVHGETQPEVIWFKDTMQLDTTERHIMENRGSRHTLIIRKVHPQDFGNYSCVAENQLGKSRKTLQLSGKPNVAVFNSPPISQYKDKYNISWTVDSHTPIEEYKLSFRRLPQGHEVGNSIDAHTAHSSSSSMLQLYNGGAGLGGGGGGGVGSASSIGGGGSILGNTNHNHRISNIGLGSYGNVMHWGRNDWRDVVLPAMPLSHHYTQGMSYMIRGLDPDQHYEATVQARNRYGWSELTHSFLFSTSSNDNEMRDLSVTYYGNGSNKRCKLQQNFLGLSCIVVILVNIFSLFNFASLI